MAAVLRLEATEHQEAVMSNMALYIVGAVLVIIGAGYAALRLGIAPVWIGIGALVILGVAIMSGVSSTRRPEESPADET
jgi:hypothetical protein